MPSRDPFLFSLNTSLSYIIKAVMVHPLFLLTINNLYVNSNQKFKKSLEKREIFY